MVTLTTTFIVDGFLTITQQTGTGIGKQIVDFLLANPNSTGLEIGDGVLNPVSNVRYTNHKIRSFMGFLLSTNQIDKVVDNGSTMISVYQA